MQWRKASEESEDSLPPLRKPVNARITDKFGTRPGVMINSNLTKGYVTFNGNLERMFQVEWLDETPTTKAGWPEEDAKIFALQFWWWVEKNNFRIMTRNQFATHGDINTFDKVWQIQELMEEYLKSHPAPKAEKEKFKPITVSGRKYMKDHPTPKAEEPHRSAEEIADYWANVFNDRNGTLTVGETIKEALKEYGFTWLQSPSIKRPTDREQENAYLDWRNNDGPPSIKSRTEAWKAAINWLLSIQSDK